VPLAEGSNVYFVGTAGCGKTTITAAFSEWLQTQGYDSVTVNLDPGAETLPYEPEVDIRDWVKLSDIMEECGLGPNGAQIAAADLLAINASKVATVLDDFETDFVLYDTPGQLELFAFRDSSKKIIEAFGREKSAICFLIDPMLARNPNGFVSSMILSTITGFRLDLPMTNVVSKTDLLSDEEIEKIEAWSNDNENLMNTLMDEVSGAQNQISIEVLRAMETVGAGGGIGFASSETMYGMEDIYNKLQEMLSGGEDKDSR
jgi:GTPase SAR1 family protein